MDSVYSIKVKNYGWEVMCTSKPSGTMIAPMNAVESWWRNLVKTCWASMLLESTLLLKDG